MKVVAEKLSRKVPDRLTVENISFEVTPGKVLGLLGPDGAGKTTILRMILDLVKPDEGSVRFDDQKLKPEIRNQIGYLPEARGVYPHHRVIDILIYFARLKRLSRKKAQVEAVRHLDRFDMIDFMEHTVQELPPEMQQKVQILVTIVHDPKLLILDEPFLGMANLNQDLIKKLILRYKEEQRTVILATQQMNLAESLCDQILLLHQGRAILQGSVGQIRKKYRENLVLVEGEDNLTDLKKISGVRKFLLQNQVARLYVDPNQPVQKVLDQIIKQVRITRLEVNRPSLEDIYLEAVNNQGEA
ncbi:MAG: ATP-binding cassette domain-containing protein [Calditrichaeota bacterium]|nr:ATP-binding cassette domain-containing protein [Calditrichota bacterium]